MKAVFFDVGSTLIYPHPSVPETFCEVVGKRGHCVSLDRVLEIMPLVDDLYEANYKADGDFWCNDIGAHQIFLDMYSLMARLTGLEADMEGISRDMHSSYMLEPRWSVYADVEPCLAALKQKGCYLGVISNWSTTLTDVLGRVGIARYFDDIIASAEVACRKPDKAIFELALSRCGLEARDCYHVGDLVEADGAAINAGITPLIIDRHQTLTDCPFAKIPSLEEIPLLID